MNEATTTTLYRPTSARELLLVRDAAWSRWPPRLPEQPIFYPVLNETYAIKIARDWNTTDGATGYVSEFEVRSTFLDRYEVHEVGGRDHVEYWIPADDLEEFNDNIVGRIEVVRAFRGAPPVDVSPSDAMVADGLLDAMGERPIPDTVCCDDMRWHLSQRCSLHMDEYSCADISVVYDAANGRFGLPVHDGGTSYIEVRFCPWCGGRLMSPPPNTPEHLAPSNAT